MADDKNLKNIKKSLEEIQKDTRKTASDTRNVRENVSELESSLKKVVASTRDSADGINRIASNTKNSGAIEKGVIQVVSKLDAIRKLTGDWAKNSDRNKGNGKGVVGNIEEKVKNILDRQNSISRAVSSMSRSVDDISYNTEKAADYLRLIKEHIVDGSASRNSVKPSVLNSDKNTKDHVSSISKNVETIVTILEDIRNNTLTSFGDEGDSLKKLIRKNSFDREKEIRQKNEYRRISGKSARSRTELEEKYLKEYRERERNRKKEEEKLNGRSGARKASEISTKIATETASLISQKQTVGGLADKGIGLISQASPLIGGLMSILKAGIQLGSERDRATSTFARTIGGSSAGKYGVGETIRSFFNNKNVNRPELGYEFNEAMSALTEVAEARGRTTERTSARDLASSINLKRAGIGAESINNFDTFGKSLEQTDKYFAKLYGEVSKKGLSFKNVSKAVNDNLKMAQSHTFANGLRGLQQMAEKSTQLKYNMQQVFQFADKVSELEGAISTSANLSVLGGQFAQFSNPMQLMYEGLNDTEALNDRILNMFGNKAYWNQEKGQMDMSALDREMLKQAAKAAGLDANEMLNVSYNQGRLRRISSQIGTGVDKDTAEYIKNLGELDENGQAYVSLNGERHFLNKSYAKRNGEKALTVDEYKELSEESKKKDAEAGATLGNIWSNTNSIFERLDKMLTYLQERLGNWVFKIFQKFVGGEESNRETVREWANRNGKDEKEAISFYDSNKGKWKFEKGSGDIWDPSKTGLGGYKNNYFAENMDKMLSIHGAKISDANEAQGNSPNGLPIASNVPGNKGFANGPSHWNGGIKSSYRGQPWEIEGNEFLLNKQSSSMYRNMLPKLQNGTFNPYSYAKDLIKNNMPNLYDSLVVAKRGADAFANDARSLISGGEKNISGTIKVDIPQTITLNLAGSGKIGDYDISGLVKEMVDKMMKEWIMRKDLSGFNKEAFPMKNVT